MSFCPDGVNVIVRNNEDHFLFVRQRYGEGKWILPGGGIEKTDPSPEAALVREVLEETYLSFFEEDVLLFCELAQRVFDENRVLVEGTLYLYEYEYAVSECQLADFRPNDEVLEVKFFSLEYILEHREEFCLGYIRMILLYMRYLCGLPPTRKLSDKVEYPLGDPAI